MLEVDEISRLYSEKIFELSGATPGKRSIVCPLPFHEHHNYTPSFSVYWEGGRWLWRCHGSCDLQGDVIDLVGYMNLPGYNPVDSSFIGKAIDILRGDKKVPTPVIPPEREEAKLSLSSYKGYYPPGQKVIDYATRRGIAKEIIDHFRIGQTLDDWMSIPAFEKGVLMGIKFRNLNQGTLRYRSAKGSKASLFNYDSVAYTQGKVFVVKGEIAAMVMLSKGLTACSPTGGETMIVRRYREILSLADTIVIGDNDPDEYGGLRQDTRNLASARAQMLHARLFFPPKEFKDVDEWILADPEAVDRLRTL